MLLGLLFLSWPSTGNVETQWFAVPHLLPQPLAALARTHFSRNGYFPVHARKSTEPSRERVQRYTSRRLLWCRRLDAVVNTRSIATCCSVTDKPESQFLRIGYPLSESMAPDGNGRRRSSRGNEANENHLIVLVPAQPRKGESKPSFAQ